MPVLGTRPKTKGVYKVIGNLCPEKNQHQSDNIFGRYFDFELRHSHVFPVSFFAL